MRGMSTSVQTVVVATEQQVEPVVTGYIAQGFTVQSRTADSVTLFKKKEFSILWLVIGLLLCVIPLLVYLVQYSREEDKMVIIKVASGGELAAPATTLPAVDQLTWSPDRNQWWDGAAWQDATRTIPPNAAYSDDKLHWWDGVAWRAVPTVADPHQER